MKTNELKHLNNKFADQGRARNFIKHSKDFNRKNLRHTGNAILVYVLLGYLIHFFV